DGNPSRFCSIKQQPDGSLREQCQTCDQRSPSTSYPASYLTDLHNVQNATCWVSEPVTDTYPNSVALTLSLGKKYEITYVTLQFCNQRPDSMIIQKSIDYGRNWTPFQYYSSQCKKMYGKAPNAQISRENEQEVLCTDAHHHSQHNSLRNNERIAFATLEGRPSAYDFETSPVLQTDSKLFVISRSVKSKATVDFDHQVH
uniref:Laminin N-terminal domain-containing protein n=1 Tax=Romanomermis culicivorax TaxID=13658 RepID=A0A915J3L0_ROMCU